MALWGKVVGGHFMNATIDTNRKGELALQLGGAAAFKRRPTLTADTVAAWEEIISETRGGTAGAISNLGQSVARAALPGRAGKAASAAVGSAVDSARGAPHTVRVEWVDGNQSLIRLPDKLFQHLAILLKDRQLQTATPPAATPIPESPPGVIGQLARLVGTAPEPHADVTEQIAKLAALRDQGALTEDEFAAKKAELLGRI
jgi:Short C-terminal domain